MPGKLIAFIFALLIVILFIFMNHNNSSDIRLWFGEKGSFTDVPIYLSFFVMYMIGVLSVIPFSIERWIKKSGKKKQKAAEEKAEKAVQAAKETAQDTSRKIPDKKKQRTMGRKNRRDKQNKTAESIKSPESPEKAETDSK